MMLSFDANLPFFTTIHQYTTYISTQMYRIRGDTIPVLFDFVCFIGRTCFLNHTIRKKLGEMGWRSNPPDATWRRDLGRQELGKSFAPGYASKQSSQLGVACVCGRPEHFKSLAEMSQDFLTSGKVVFATSMFFVVVVIFRLSDDVFDLSDAWSTESTESTSTVQVSGIACQPTSQQCSKVHCAMENLWRVCSSQGVWACTWWPTWRTGEAMEGYWREDVFFSPRLC